MKLALRQSGATKAVVALHVRKSGVTKVAERAWLRTGGVLKQILGAFSVTVSRNAEGWISHSGTVGVTTWLVTASATGAIGSATYSWARTDGGAHSWSINSPSSASTTFTTNVAAGDEEDATFACTITDSAGQTATTANVRAFCTNDYFAA